MSDGQRRRELAGGPAPVWPVQSDTARPGAVGQDRGSGKNRRGARGGTGREGMQIAGAVRRDGAGLRCGLQWIKGRRVF